MNLLRDATNGIKVNPNKKSQTTPSGQLGSLFIISRHYLPHSPLDALSRRIILNNILSLNAKNVQKGAIFRRGVITVGYKKSKNIECSLLRKKLLKNVTRVSQF